MASIEIEGWDQVSKCLEALGPKRALPLLRVSIDVGTRKLVSELRDRWLSGPTDSSHVSSRSGKLRQSIRPVPAAISGTEVVGGIAAGLRYAKVHIGQRGRVWTMRPTSHRYLAIPLPAAKTGAGVARGRPQDESVFGETFIRRSLRGNLIIFGKQVVQRGAKQGETRGKIVPLFLLKESVRVPTRVPLDMLSQQLGVEIGRQVLRGLVKTEVTPNA